MWILKVSPKADGGIGNKIIYAIEMVKEFGNKHPVLTAIVKGIGGAVAFGVAAKVLSNGGKTTNSSLDYFSTTDSGEDHSTAFDTEEKDALPIQRDYPDKRSSPCEHEVSGHWQQYGKNKELKWVDPYPRGGSKDD